MKSLLLGSYRYTRTNITEQIWMFVEVLLLHIEYRTLIMDDLSMDDLSELS